MVGAVFLVDIQITDRQIVDNVTIMSMFLTLQVYSTDLHLIAHSRCQGLATRVRLMFRLGKVRWG
jgi:hypothetical protein